jgi:hypothetical protein
VRVGTCTKKQVARVHTQLSLKWECVRDDTGTRDSYATEQGARATTGGTPFGSRTPLTHSPRQRANRHRTNSPNTTGCWYYDLPLYARTFPTNAGTPIAQTTPVCMIKTRSVIRCSKKYCALCPNQNGVIVYRFVRENGSRNWGKNLAGLQKANTGVIEHSVESHNARFTTVHKPGLRQVDSGARATCSAHTANAGGELSTRSLPLPALAGRGLG